MRIAFMGSPIFAADILEDIYDVHDIVCVYTMPDKVRSRGNSTKPTPVKIVANHLGIEVRCPNSFNDSSEIKHLKSFNLDVICVAAYGKILPKQVLEIPKYGCLNVHASLLPKWRGAAPIERAILSGESKIGVCIMQMEEGLDTGDFCIQRSVETKDKSAQLLTFELASLGSQALLTALAQIEAGQIVWTKQNDSEATYASKISKGELNLSPDFSMRENVLKIRSSSEAHPSRILLNNNPVIITSADEIGSSLPDDVLKATKSSSDELLKSDVAFTKKRLFLKCADGFIEVLSLKPAGKKDMPVASYLAGSRFVSNIKWGSID